MTARTKAYLLLFIATLIWGVAGPVIKFTLEFLPPSVFLTYRVGLQALLGLVWLRFIKQPGWPKDPVQLGSILLYSFLSIPIGLGLLFLGYSQTSALAVSIIDALYPMMVAVAGVIWLREHVTHREKWGMGIALLGTALVIIEPFFNRQVRHGTSLTGNLLIVASLVVGVVSVVMAKLIMRHKINPLAMTHVTFIIGFFFLLPISIFQFGLGPTVQSILAAPLSAHLGVFFMAFISGTLAYWMWLIAEKSIEIGETAMFSYLYPVITLPLAVWWLHESVTPILIAGAAVIAIGVILAEIKSGRHQKTHPSRR
ncbi:MAG: DMT family transporter [bacterium]|nr:DMT family transporter [bacterium]